MIRQTTEQVATDGGMVYTMRTKLRSQISELAHELEKESEAAFELWTWLPSHRAAEESHEDYASELTPPPHEVMEEANHALRWAAGEPFTPESGLKWIVCPCGVCELSNLSADEARVRFEQWREWMHSNFVR